MSSEQIYLYRRKGLSDYATCDRARYVELSQHNLFETKVCYASAEPEEGDHDGRQLEWERCENKRLRAELGECKGEYDRAVNKVDALRDQLEQAQADLVRMTEGRDGLRSTLDEANKIIAWQRTELDQLKKNAGHSALRREAFDKLAQAVAAGAPIGDVYACDSAEPTNKEGAQ
jgi:chromosome segregation ATPase